MANKPKLVDCTVCPTPHQVDGRGWKHHRAAVLRAQRKQGGPVVVEALAAVDPLDAFAIGRALGRMEAERELVRAA